ncbi:MAG: family 10 glycosylhydrolase [Spirulinaceae cyanobacterium]
MVNSWQQATGLAILGSFLGGSIVSGSIVSGSNVNSSAVAQATPLVVAQHSSPVSSAPFPLLTEGLGTTDGNNCPVTDVSSFTLQPSQEERLFAQPRDHQSLDACEIRADLETPRIQVPIGASFKPAPIAKFWGSTSRISDRISDEPRFASGKEEDLAPAIANVDTLVADRSADLFLNELTSTLPATAPSDSSAIAQMPTASSDTAAPDPLDVPDLSDAPTSPSASSTKQSAAALQSSPFPVTPVSQRQLAPLLAAAPTSVRQRYARLTQLVNRYESAVIAAESHRLRATDTSFLETVRQLASSAQTESPLPESLQQVRQEMQQLFSLLARKEYSQVNAGIQRLERLIWQQYPLEQPISHPASRAMWLDRGTIVRTRSERELARIFNRLADAGINTVFFETLNASYPIYPSRVAPEQNPLTQGWDPLAAAVKLAHERGMELHAWVWIFAAANQRHNTLMGQPTNYLGPVLSRHPDWAMYDRRGNAFQPNSRKAFYDPANPEVRAYLLGIVDEIATRYDVDGIQLDYIRYPFQDPRTDLSFGFGIAARRQFHRQTGVDPATIRPQDGRWRQWTQFRIQQVSTFVQSASQLLRQQHPDVLLSAAVFPFPANERLAKLQQNWETWLDQDYLDFLVPMTYAQNTAEFEVLTAPVLNHNQRGSTLLLPGIRLLQLPTVGTLDQLQHLQDRATGGYALFAAENLSLPLQSSLRGRHGRQSAQTTEPIAHRQPLPAAFARYQALQHEWQYWVAHQQLALSPQTLEQWATAAVELETKLQQASQTPSATHRRQAQRALSEFQRQFPQWLAPVATTTPYRLQVWQQRLLGIDQLLRYSERRS